ncbi:hypothetical protein [Vulgatibacter incomptus]|uniref:Transmembrane protein n=1 Tax=Vulgatibacter incomptus TaxID=1391653 RepID=A0A0K1P845_9BACT|nr:hypothetical protein [Vulgatibacter incomptus]AKU89695.1 hypothetical protein AKJ08_0082 [Vulgatibacter incomptus]
MSDDDRRRYERLYPHPAQGLDTEAARRRVEAHPSVMPPNPEPVRFGRLRNRERFGLRLGAVLGLVAAGFFAPFFVRMLGRRQARPWERDQGQRILWRLRNGPFGRRVLLVARR